MSWDKARMSDCRDPEHRSRKLCCCGIHSMKAKNASRKKIRLRKRRVVVKR